MILCDCYFYNPTQTSVGFSNRGKSHTTGVPAPMCTQQSSQFHLLPVPRNDLCSILDGTAALLTCCISAIPWLVLCLLLLAFSRMCSLTRNSQVPFANLFRPRTFYLLGQDSSPLIKKPNNKPKRVRDSQISAWIQLTCRNLYEWWSYRLSLASSSLWCLFVSVAYLEENLYESQTKQRKQDFCTVHEWWEQLVTLGSWCSLSFQECHGNLSPGLVQVGGSGGNPDFSWFLSVLSPAVGTVQQESRWWRTPRWDEELPASLPRCLLWTLEPCTVQVAAGSHCAMECTATLALLGSSSLHILILNLLSGHNVSSALTKIWLASVFAGLFFSPIHLSFFKKNKRQAKSDYYGGETVPRRQNASIREKRKRKILFSLAWQ